MYIKEILKYDSNYAEYIVTDGNYDIRCMCVSVPLPLNKKPEVGMSVISISAFCFNDIKIKIINDNKDKFSYIQNEKSWFEYTLRGKIIDVRKALVSVKGFIISLEYDFDSGFPNDYKENDFIEFTVDRLDAKLVD